MNNQIIQNNPKMKEIANLIKDYNQDKNVNDNIQINFQKTLYPSTIKSIGIGSDKAKRKRTFFSLMERPCSLKPIFWQTVRQVRGRIMYLFIALLIHFAVDFSTVILTSMIPLAAYEVILLAVSAVIFLLSLRLYRNTH